MTGTEQLRQQLERMTDALRAFSDPIVEQTPGLRLMHETLQERKRHIAQQIRKNETAAVTIRISGDLVSDDGAPARLIAVVLAAVRDAAGELGVAIAADWDAGPAADEIRSAVEPHLKSLESNDDLMLLITRPPGALGTQLTEPETNAPLGEVVLHRLISDVALLVDGKDVSDVTGAAVRPLAELLVASPLTVALSFSGHVLDPVDVTIDRAAAHRLLQR